MLPAGSAGVLQPGVSPPPGRQQAGTVGGARPQPPPPPARLPPRHAAAAPGAAGPLHALGHPPTCGPVLSPDTRVDTCANTVICDTPVTRDCYQVLRPNTTLDTFQIHTEMSGQPPPPPPPVPFPYPPVPPPFYSWGGAAPAPHVPPHNMSYMTPRPPAASLAQGPPPTRYPGPGSSGGHGPGAGGGPDPRAGGGGAGVAIPPPASLRAGAIVPPTK